LAQLTHAESALVVNNCAAALLLTLTALAHDREVVVSRGQLVEIGGGFRIPDVMTQGGARLVEVGTTNKTRLADYERALTPHTAMLLKVHSSNFQQLGFVETTPLHEMVNLAHARQVLVVEDVGSGALLDTADYGLTPEPTVQASIQAGADLVLFSGDKLLGGPQAGIIVGRADLIHTLSKHTAHAGVACGQADVTGFGCHAGALSTWRRSPSHSHLVDDGAQAG
jgi:L-seryl-tRNA(Ser) seleniumtransferase